MKKLKILMIVPLLAFCLNLSGCSAYNDTLAGLNTLGQIITVAEADIPTLEAAGTFSAADAAAAQSWLQGLGAIQSQSVACVNTVGSKGAKASFAVCVTEFGIGLLSPTEMADLRLLSPSAQKQATIWVTALVLAANAVSVIVNATPVVAPVVGTSPSAQDLRDFGTHAGFTEKQFEAVGL